MGRALEIATPRWALPLLQPARDKGVHGGRGSGKSHQFAEMLIEEHIYNQSQRSVCLREVQKSIKYSVKQLLDDKIEKMGAWDYFQSQEAIIKSRKGDGIILFQGMQNHTSDSIKSLEGFDRSWFEEAQNASQRSIDLLRPTIRKPGSELWWSWNPENEDDPVDVMLRTGPKREGAIIIEANYMDNPWFPDVLRDEMEYDKRRDPDKYQHIWLGGYQKHSNSRVFTNWRIEEFESDPEAMYRFGADWGFSVDPTVLVRCYIIGRKLYIDHEAYQVGCEIMDTPDLFRQVPEAEMWPITADNARPETISHMRNNGFPKIMQAVKGPGSLEDGIEWIKTHDIIVHPRCVHTIDELSSYRYKVDDKTQQVLPVLEDKHNHVIDALRYAVEGARRAKAASRKAAPAPATPMAHRWK